MAVAEPFPVLTTPADGFASSSDANGSALRRRHQRLSSCSSDPSLATSIAHANGQQHAKANGSATSKRYSKRRKARSMARRVKAYAVKHTWVLPLVMLLVFLGAYAVNPNESNPIHHFIFLSYKLPIPPDAPPNTPPQYGKGLWDIAFVTFYTIFLSFTREFVMHEMLRPLARCLGLRSRGKQVRFMEQMYTAVYFSILGPIGLYIMSRTPMWFFNTRAMYEGFPHKTHEADFKFYYLFQAAYWAQQVIVMAFGLEKPRKDYKELIGHHIISVSLIGLSYRFHFTYIGLPVYITHDISDFFLATSKSLNYVQHPLVGPYFFLFMSVWIYMRHYLNLRIIWSLFTEFRTVGPFELNWETQQYKCWISQYITLGLLSFLQSLNLFWLYLIVRIAYRFVVNKEADDDRSEAEDSEPEAEPEEKAPLLANGHADGTTNGAVKEANDKVKANGSASER